MPGSFRNSRRMGTTPGGRLVGQRGGRGTPTGRPPGRDAGVIQMTGRPVFEEAPTPAIEQARAAKVAVEQMRFLRAAQRMPRVGGGG